MVSFMIISLLRGQITAGETITAGGYALRIGILLCLLGVYIFLFVLLQKSVQKGKIRKPIAVLLSIVLVVEAVVLLPFLQGEKEVSLEYVGCVETVDTWRETEEPQWYTNCTIYGESADIEQMEREFGCNLSRIDFDTEQFTYLFVYAYEDVSLTYSNWSISTGQLIPPQTAYWYGNLTVEGEAVEDQLYIFRFPKKTIVRHELQWF